MSDSAPSPSSIHGSPSAHSNDDEDAEIAASLEVGSESQETENGGNKEEEGEEEGGRRRRSTRRVAATIVPPPPPPKNNNNNKQRQKPNSTTSQKATTSSSSTAATSFTPKQPFINPDLPPPPGSSRSLPKPPAPPAPKTTKPSASSSSSSVQHVPSPIKPTSKSPPTPPSPAAPASPSPPPPSAQPVQEPAASPSSMTSSPLPEPIRRSTSASQPPRPPPPPPPSRPSPHPAATASSHPDGHRVSAPPSSSARPSATPSSKPLKIVEEGGREVIELGDSDDDDDDDEERFTEPKEIVKQEEEAEEGGGAAREERDVENISDSGDDEEDSEDDDEEEEEDEDDDDGSDVELLSGPGGGRGGGGGEGDQSEGVDDDEEREDRDHEGMEGIVDQVGAASTAMGLAPPNGHAAGSSLNPLDHSAPPPLPQLNGAPSASVDPSLATNAEAGSSLLPVNAPLLPVKKVTRRKRTPSVTPPPPLRKPDITLRLNVPLSLEKGTYDEFSLYEKAFEAGIYDQDVMSIWSIRGQKEEEQLVQKKMEEKKEKETEEEAMARLLEEKYGKDEHRPKKRRKRQEKEDDYDVRDPFIDDSTAAIDAPEFTGVTVQGGFFVHMGAVELKEMEAPAPKPRAPRKSIDPNAPPRKPRASGIRPDGTPMSPHSGTGYMRDGLSPTAEMFSRRPPRTPTPEPEPKPEISPEVEEALRHLKEEVSKCDWSNKGKFPPHMRPIVAEVAKTAIRTDCYTQPFFDRMPGIFPYNKFTITKLIRKEVNVFHTQFLNDHRKALVEAFQKEVDAVKEDRMETHEAAVTAFEEAEKVKLEDEKEAPKPHPFFPPPPPSTYTPQANRSATPEIIPPTTINDEGKTNPTSTEPQGPVKKFLFSPEMKKILWALHLNNVHMMESANEIAKYTPGTAELTLTPLNKQLYADLVPCFPPGYMTTTNISRALSALKDADKKKKAAAEKDKAEREAALAAAAAVAEANANGNGNLHALFSHGFGGGGGGGGSPMNPVA